MFVEDQIPTIGGDTLWASGYAAYEKLSPEFRRIIDGRTATFESAHTYIDRNDPHAGPKHIERIHPIVRVHPATGWKALFVNRAFTKRIIGLDKDESDVILNYLFDVYERVCFQAVRKRCMIVLTISRTLTFKSDSSGVRVPVRFGTTASRFTMQAGITKVQSHDMERELHLLPRSLSSKLMHQREDKLWVLQVLMSRYETT